jgi:ACR3 family arsenite efflux pump ArsB
MNKNLLQSIRPLILVFVFLTAFFISGKSWFEKKGVDQDVLIAGNLILFLVSLSAFLITNKALASSNPQAFVRAMYSSFIIKFFVLAITAFVYIMVAKKNVNKPALIACAGLYIIYTGIETSALMKMLKQKKNG